MHQFLRQSKDDYVKLLIANGALEQAEEMVNRDIYEPFLTVRESHPQLEPSPKNYNEMITESYHDIYTLYQCLSDSAYDFSELMTSTKKRLDVVKKQLLVQKEKLEDLNILCGKYMDFDTVISLDETNLTGSYSISDGVISAKATSQDKIGYSLESIEGNGYEGNEYVYKNNAFLKKTIDTSNRKFITDSNILTTYEYSRITANNSESEIVSAINQDSIEAKMTMTLSSKTAFNKVKINVASKDTVITNISTSVDGITYHSILNSVIKINDAAAKYGADSGYIANSGLLCFPSTYYLKITLESDGVTDDIIAFEKTVIEKKGW